MMNCRRDVFDVVPPLIAVVLMLTDLPMAPAQELADEPPSIRVELRMEREVVPIGQPVWAEFAVINLLPEVYVLEVPGAQVVQVDPLQGVGLPTDHLFSGGPAGSLSVYDDQGRLMNRSLSEKFVSKAPAVPLAPFGSVGVRVDLSRHLESIKRPGKYVLKWHPYGGTIESAPAEITILAERQAAILTDFGTITIRFYYHEAPRHVQNFVELVEQRFYDGLMFHRVIPGGLIQGGDPRGDGMGIRLDGKRLKGEFNDIPFEYGTVGMARMPKDPDSASCQFFICLSRQPSFDGNQTAFAYVVFDDSFETLRRIAAVPTGSKDRPRRPVYIRAISLENVPVRERDVAQPADFGTQGSDTAHAREPGIDNSGSRASNEPEPRIGLRAVRKPVTTLPAEVEDGG